MVPWNCTMELYRGTTVEVTSQNDVICYTMYFTVHSVTFPSSKRKQRTLIRNSYDRCNVS